MKHTASPLVSVIVPVYNVEKYLVECIDSILAQSYSNLEIILVDDGSTDQSGAICDQYAAQHSEKVKVIHKSNGGLSSARNAGLDAATGEYISFIDSDDKIKPSMIGDKIGVIEKFKVDVVSSNFIPIVDSQSRYHKVAPPLSEPMTGTGSQVLSYCFNWKTDRSVVTKLFRRSVIGDLRFHIGKINEDFPFICELYLKDPLVYVMTDAYYMYRYNENSISTVFKKSFFDIFDNLDYVDKLIPSENSTLRKDFDRYSLQMHIMSAMKIVRCRKNGEYKDWLRVNRNEMIRSWKRLLFDSKLGFRWRVKALIGFLHIP